MTSTTLDAEALRAALWRDGAIAIPNVVPPEVLSSLERWLEVEDFDEAWWHCEAGREIVVRVRDICRAMFGFHLLDPFRLECTGGEARKIRHVELVSQWHRDNWPLTAAYQVEERFFHCRPVLFLSDVDDLSVGPTEYLPGTHLRSRWHERAVAERGVPMLGKTGDLWLMASRVWHRRALDTSARQESATPRIRRAAWMVCKTELPHP